MGLAPIWFVCKHHFRSFLPLSHSFSLHCCTYFVNLQIDFSGGVYVGKISSRLTECARSRVRCSGPHPPRLHAMHANENYEAVHLPLYTRPIRYRSSWLRPSDLAAHERFRLMLLGSPPDMVHGHPLRKTRPSTLLAAGSRYVKCPGAGVRPRYSGLRVQGTAGSPTSTAPMVIIRHRRLFSKWDFVPAQKRPPPSEDGGGAGSFQADITRRWCNT